MALTLCACLRPREAPIAVTTSAPKFVAPAHDGTLVALDDLTAHGPLVLVFYRGHW